MYFNTSVICSAIMHDADLSKWMENIDLGGDPPDLHSDFDDSHRNRVMKVLREFCQHLYTRLRMFAPYGPEAVDIFDTDEELEGSHIGQETHTFLRDFFISPIVDVLGYVFVTEPRVPEAKSQIWMDGIHPDLQLIPREWPADETVPTIIIEYKKFGRFNRACTQLREKYLSKGRRPVYGIATDVLTWRSYRSSPEEGPEQMEHVSIQRLLQNVREEVRHERYEANPDPDQIDSVLSLFESLPGNIG
jgi:hypothetical protein